jgi:hypothetical protein
MAQGSDLYKDRVEVSLDGRQIFYLFFGGAVVTCMVFVLGVVVGKKVEARSHVDRLHSTSARDPLAALDRIEGSEPLTFRNALSQGQVVTAPVEQEIADLQRVRAAATTSAKSSKESKLTSEPASVAPKAVEPAAGSSKDKDAKDVKLANDSKDAKNPKAVASDGKDAKVSKDKNNKSSVDLKDAKLSKEIKEQTESKDSKAKFTLQSSKLLSTAKELFIACAAVPIKPWMLPTKPRRSLNIR